MEKEKMYVCACCGEKHSIEHMKAVKIKDSYKEICDECVETIHGLV